MQKSARSNFPSGAKQGIFRPSLIDYDSLSPEDILENDTLAYTLLKEELGIPSLLDPQDILDMEAPDKLSIVPYAEVQKMGEPGNQVPRK